MFCHYIRQRVCHIFHSKVSTPGLNISWQCHGFPSFTCALVPALWSAYKVVGPSFSRGLFLSFMVNIELIEVTRIICRQMFIADAHLFQVADRQCLCILIYYGCNNMWLIIYSECMLFAGGQLVRHVDIGQWDSRIVESSSPCLSLSPSWVDFSLPSEFHRFLILPTRPSSSLSFSSDVLLVT